MARVSAEPSPTTSTAQAPRLARQHTTGDVETGRRCHTAVDVQPSAASTSKKTDISHAASAGGGESWMGGRMRRALVRH